MQKILETLRISIVKNLFTGRDKEIIGVNSSCCRNGSHLIIIAGILTLEKHSKSLPSSFLLLKWLWVNRVETSVWHQSDSFFNKSLSLVLTRCHTNHLSEAFSFILFLKFVIFNWRIIVLQHFIGFCHTSMWVCHRYTYVLSLLNLPPTLHSIPSL